MHTIHLIRQHDQRDCGAACLAMIAVYYGLRLPLSTFRELTKTDRTGANLYGLVDGAKKIGLEGNALSGSSDELLSGIQNNEIKFPFIAHTVSQDGMMHFIVIYELKNGSFSIADPGKGKYKLTQEKFLEQWTGYIVTFTKTSSFHPGNTSKKSFIKFFTMLNGQYKKLVGVMMLSLITATIGILGAFIFQTIIDNFTSLSGYTSSESSNSNLLIALTGYFNIHVTDFNFFFIFVIFLYLLQAAIQIIRGYLIISVSSKIDLRLTLSYYNHLIGLPISSIAVRQTGEYLSRFTDARTIRTAISTATITLLLDSVMAVGCGIILYLQSHLLFFISLIMVLLYAIIVLLFRKPVEQSNRTMMENNARVQSYLKESIDGIQTVKAACADNHIKEQTADKVSRFVRSAFRGNFIAISQETCANTVELIGTIIILWYGFSLVASNQMTIGILMTFYMLLAYFTNPIKNLIELQPTIQTAIVAADRLNDILELSCEETINTENKLPIINCWTLKNVDFRYGNHELTLQNINLTIHRGEKIALVGESGSGKTTLAKLLLRFYEAEKGEILLDNYPIQDLDLSALRNSIAYVNQNTFLFADTIFNNLKLGNPNATEEEIHHACEISHASSFIEALPLGYNTPLDENGSNLSGGQRQRLALARALLKNSQLLILDEATSNLDTITESSIKDTIFEFNNDLTCIIIAHRLSTIKNCDRIYVIDNGQIVETGTHAELLNLKGKYYDFWNRQ